MALNESVATRSPMSTFKMEKEKHADCILVGDPTVTKRLKKRGINLHSCPTGVTPGYIGKLGRINYAAAIDADDSEAVTALEEERTKRKIETDQQKARNILVHPEWYPNDVEWAKSILEV